MQNKNICKFSVSPLTDSLSVSCFVQETDPAIMEKPALLKEYRMILVSGGTGVIQFDRQCIPFKRGSLIFGFANERFSVTDMVGCEYMYLSFSGVRAETLLHRFGIYPCNRCFSGFEGLIPFWTESLARASVRTIDLTSESVLLYVFSRLFESGTERNDLLSQVIVLTEDRFRDPTFTLTAVAECLNYNTKYLSTMFKKKMGLSFSEYLRTLRIKYAVSLLECGLDSVKNVALLSGFSDPLYFSTVFKSSLGVSPREYQKNLTESEEITE